MSLEGLGWIGADHLPNPFPAAADVRAYIPRPATEGVLTYLEAKVEGAPGWYELCGPGGVGKTLLLRLLAARVSRSGHPVHVPFPRLDPQDLARWVLDALGRPAGPSPRASLVASAQEQLALGRPLILLVDDAHRLPPETAAWLATLCVEEAGVRVVAAVNEGAPRRSPDADARAFAEPLELADVVPFVDSLLARVAADDALRGLFVGAPLHSLALESGGVPRRIQKLADARIVEALRNRAASQPPAGQAGPAPAAPPGVVREARRFPSAPSGAVASERATPAAVPARQPRVPARRALVALLAASVVAGAVWGLAMRAPFDGARPELPAPRTKVPEAPAADAPAAWVAGAILHVPARPGVREVRVDGQPLGAPPLTVVGLPPGRHLIEAELDDGTRRPLEAELRGGRQEVVFDGAVLRLGARGPAPDERMPGSGTDAVVLPAR